MPAFLAPQWMLLYGLITSVFVQERPRIKNFSKKWSKNLLQLSIILLGAKLKIGDVIANGATGFKITLVSLSVIFICGMALRKLFKLDRIQSLLITFGTAICGGSAIAAISPILGASGGQIAISMGVVFFLNALAVFIFPPLGHWLHYDQAQFGLFSALAIHDTSSVVAASAIYGEKAMALATIYKLTRALWIIPITVGLSIVENKDGKAHPLKKVKIPSFIIGFILICALFSFVTALAPLRPYFSLAAKVGLSVTLGLIGLGMDLKDLKQSGLNSVLFGVSLWLITIVVSFLLIRFL